MFLVKKRLNLHINGYLNARIICFDKKKIKNIEKKINNLLLFDYRRSHC